MSHTVTTPLMSWLPNQRWFTEKASTVTRVDVAGVVDLLDQPGAAGRRAVLYLLEVHVLAGEPGYYQVVLDAAPDRGIIRDATTDPDVAMAMFWHMMRGSERGGLTFHSEQGAAAPVPCVAGLVRPVGAEQTNTSVVLDDRVIIKLFRKVAAGLNPDLELHQALTRAGSPHIAELLGAVEGRLLGQPATFAIANRYVPNTGDGWASALEGAGAPGRQRRADGFAKEAWRMGAAIASVHADLAAQLGTYEVSPAVVAKRFREELDEAVSVVPDLAPYAGRLGEAYRQITRATDAIVVQHVHGDLHLGQLLRGEEAWCVVDFEGEPARPLARRGVPQSPLRDVASMLGSFDYAARHLASQGQGQGEGSSRGHGEAALRGHGEAASQRWLARWALRNRAMFCDGYASASGVDPRAMGALLRAYELARLVYEVTYEARSRPEWLHLPLGTLDRRLTAGLP